MLHQDQWTRALFTLDFSETKKRMLERFEAWLDLPENKERLKLYNRDTTGKTGESKDRLKDLATWRLYEGLPAHDRFNRLIKFTQDNRKKFANPTRIGGVQYKKGDDMPFHDARKGQSREEPLNKAPLYSEESSVRKAIGEARKYLAKIIRWEFGDQSGSEVAKEVIKRYEMFMKGDVKISKSSS